MSKDPHFIGQPVLTQVLKYLPTTEKLDQMARNMGADRYVKRFKASEHLKTFIFAVAGRVNSIRELNTALAAHENKLSHIGIQSSVARSTFSDANNRRNPDYFKKVYKKLLETYDKYLSDSSLSTGERNRRKRVFAMDSTTVPLFTSIFQGVGRKNTNGRRKGGLKVHTVIDTFDSVPRFIYITDAIRHDSMEAKALLELPKGSTVVIDRGYYDFALFEKLKQKGIHYITRIKRNVRYEIIKEQADFENDPNTSLDYQVRLAIDKENEYQITEQGHTSRLLAWFNKKKNTHDAYLTSLNDISGKEIHNTYALRWKIETLFKKLKQNFNFTNFLSQSRNGIMIQIWCILITFLLLEIIHIKVKRRIAFSVMITDLRITLMTYIDFIEFLNDPEKAKREMKSKRKGPPNKSTYVQQEFDFG